VSKDKPTKDNKDNPAKISKGGEAKATELPKTDTPPTKKDQASISKKTDWNVHTAAPDARFDPLLDCLMSLTKLYENPVSEETLLSGLPLQEKRLSPRVFPRAAKRASLSAKVVKTLLLDINPELCPVILLLHGRKACLVTRITADGSATVIQPESGEGQKIIHLSDLEKDYMGHAIFVSPIYRFDKRAKEPGKQKKKHWFWSVMRKAAPAYSEVLVASLLINMFAVAIPLFVMNVYDRVVPNNAIETLWALGIGIIIVVVFEFILRTLRNYFIDNAARDIDNELSADTFEQVLDINMASRPKSVGALANTNY